MKRVEFIEQSRQSQRRQSRWMFGLLASLTFFAFGGNGVITLLDLADPTAAKLAIVAGFTAVAIIGLVALVRISSRDQFRCPQCKKEIGAISAQVVIASGRCGFCGTRILDDATAEP